MIGEALRPETQSGNLTFEGALSERRGPGWTNGYGSPYSRRAFFIAPRFSHPRLKKEVRYAIGIFYR